MGEKEEYFVIAAENHKCKGSSDVVAALGREDDFGRDDQLRNIFYKYGYF